MRPAASILLLAGLLTATRVPAEISGGELRLLTRVLDPPPHHHSKRIEISAGSLDSGWVRDRQCHMHLDPVAALEIVFGADKLRWLRITRSENIGSAKVVGPSVQLQDVGKNAVLCLEGELRLLERDRLTGHYVLTTGPYMRRFLDGYFPMRLTVEISYPPDRLRFVELQPDSLRARTRVLPGRVNLSALFEGRLFVEMRFETVGEP
jgi:hypothetical protein